MYRHPYLINLRKYFLVLNFLNVWLLSRWGPKIENKFKVVLAVFLLRNVKNRWSFWSISTWSYKWPISVKFRKISLMFQNFKQITITASSYYPYLQMAPWVWPERSGPATSWGTATTSRFYSHPLCHWDARVNRLKKGCASSWGKFLYFSGGITFSYMNCTTKW